MSLRRPVFSLFGIWKGTLLINAANSLFPQKPQVCGKSGALCQKCDFGTRSKFLEKEFKPIKKNDLRMEKARRGAAKAALRRAKLYSDENLGAAADPLCKSGIGTNDGGDARVRAKGCGDGGAREEGKKESRTFLYGPLGFKSFT